MMAYGCMKKGLLSLVNLKLAAEYGRPPPLDRVSSGSRLVAKGTETNHTPLTRTIDRKVGSRLLDKLLPVSLGSHALLR